MRTENWFPSFYDSNLTKDSDRLLAFLDGMSDLFSDVLESDRFFHASSALKVDVASLEAARAAWPEVRQAVDRLKDAVAQLDLDSNQSTAVSEFGLSGQLLKHKLTVIWECATHLWNRHLGRGQWRIRENFKRAFDAIDALLDSLIAATGCGHLIKEFKDALCASASTRP